MFKRLVNEEKVTYILLNSKVYFYGFAFGDDELLSEYIETILSGNIPASVVKLETLQEVK